MAKEFHNEAFDRIALYPMTSKLKATKELGKTGIKVSRVVYGTSYLGNLYQELSYADKLSIMEQWFECTEAPVVIDSAGKYGAGLALEVIGRGLQDLGIAPESIIISNKLGWYRVPLEAAEPTFEPGAWVGLENDAIQLFGYEEIIRCFEQGNKLLGGMYGSQLVSVHDPDEYLAAAKDQKERQHRLGKILESYKALFELKEQGKVTAVGIGSKDWKVIRELYDKVKFDWVMFANSFTVYSHPVELLQFMDVLQAERVGIINSAVFHGGFLTGGDKFDYQDVDQGSEKGRKLYEWRSSFRKLGEQFKVAMADACLHFALSHPAIVSIALNTSKPEKMKGNAEMIEKNIPAEFWQAMKETGLIDRDYRYLYNAGPRSGIH